MVENRGCADTHLLHCTVHTIATRCSHSSGCVSAIRRVAIESSDLSRNSRAEEQRRKHRKSIRDLLVDNDSDP